MKKIFSTWKWLQLVEAILLIALGVVIAIGAWFNDFHTALGYIVAIFLIVDGAMLLLVKLLAKNFDYDAMFAISCVLIGLGAMLCWIPDVVVASLPVFVATALFAFALFEIVRTSYKIAKQQYKAWEIVLWYAVAAVAIAVGIITLCFLNVAAQVIIFVAGLALVFAGITMIVQTAIIARRAKKVSSNNQDKKE